MSADPRPLQASERITETDFADVIAAHLNAPNRVPRTWLSEEIRTRLKRPDCRYVLLLGEPGAGKSGLMASLARAEPAWLRYFIRADSITPLSSGEASSVLLSLGLQLACKQPQLFDPEALEIVVEQRVRQAEPTSTVTGVQIGDLRASPFYRTSIRVRQDVEQAGGLLRAVQIERATLEPRLLQPDILGAMALLDPAALLGERSPGETIVVLIDALDELGADSAETILDWLESGPSLPPNLRFILASRPSPRLNALCTVRSDAIERLEIDTDSTEVAADVEAFARGLFSEHAALAPIDVEAAVRGLVAAAQGNFAYLTAYGRALRAAAASDDLPGQTELLSFSVAPSGLESLYATFVRQIKRRVARLGRLELADPGAGEGAFVDPWEAVAQRLLGILVVARAPLTLDQLANLGGVHVWPSAQKGVIQLFAPFLDETPQGLQLFHASFAEILTDGERPAIADIALDAEEWSRRIVGRYQQGQAWADVDWRRVDDYGLLHVASHLAATRGGVSALGEVITPSLRSACLDRFKTELAFRDLAKRAQAAFTRAEDPAVAFSESLFIGLVLKGISLEAGSLDPAVYGLMARLGRVGEALARLELTAPSLEKFRSLEAVVASAPPAERQLLGPGDGVELLVETALSVPDTDTALVGHLGHDRDQCLRSAAVALATLDLQRALGLLDQVRSSLSRKKDYDSVLASAARGVPAEVALQLAARMSEGGLYLAIDAAGRAGNRSDRDAFTEAALAYIAKMPAADRVLPLTDLLELYCAAGEAPRANELEARLRDVIAKAELLESGDESASSSSLDHLALAAALRLAGFRPELAHELTERFGRDPRDANAALQAAAANAQLDESAACRKYLEAALEEYRGRGWYGPAADIAAASMIARHVDPVWAESLADEAMAMLRAAGRAGDRENEDERFEFALGAAARSFGAADRPRTLALARMMRGGWVPGGTWESYDGRGNCLAMIGLSLAQDDPAAAEELLSEAMEPGMRPRCGRATAELTDAGLFKAASDTDGDRRLDLSYVMNSNNYWEAGRAWRWLETPHDLLDSVTRSYPAGASWALALADNMEKIAEHDIEAAITLTGRLLDPGERLVALAGLVKALHQRSDPRLAQAVSWLEATIGAQGVYTAGGSLEQIPNGAALAYLDPTARMRIEAALRLPEAFAGIGLSLARLCRSQYLATCWQAQGLWQHLIDAIGVTLPPKSLGAILERFNETDELLGDMVRVAWVRLSAPDDPDLARRIISEIQAPALATLARLYGALADPSEGDLIARFHRVLEDAPDDLSLPHMTDLVRRACELCQADGVDALPLVDYGLSGLQQVHPLTAVRGAATLAWVAPPDGRAMLLTQALDGLDRIAVIYHRNEALAEVAACIASTTDSLLLARCAQRLVSAGWMTLAVALGRALPHLIDNQGFAITERVGAAMVRAQAVIGAPPDGRDEPEHMDGVGPANSASWMADPRTAYLTTYLVQADLDDSLSRVQDSRLSGPDEDDEAFERCGGIFCGLAAWEDGPDATVGRLVDIRFTFASEAGAIAYQRERLACNSEGQPRVDHAPAVGEDCAVFGGTRRLDVAGEPVSMTAFHYVFRVGRMVAKVFVAQRPRASIRLTPEHVTDLALRAEARMMHAV